MRPSCAPHAPHMRPGRRPEKVDGWMNVEKGPSGPVWKILFLRMHAPVVRNTYYMEETIPRQHTVQISSRDLSDTMLHRWGHVFLPYKNL